MKKLSVFIILASLVFAQGCSLMGGGKSAEQHAPAAIAPLPSSAQSDYDKASKLWRSDDTSSDPQASLVFLNKVIQAAPSYAPALRMRGFTLLQLEQKESAFEDLTSAIRLDPSPAMYAARALLCLRSNLPTAARRDVEYALRLEPELALGYAVRGQIRRKEGDDKAACSDFAKACSLGNCLALDDAKQAKLCF